MKLSHVLASVLLTPLVVVAGCRVCPPLHWSLVEPTHTLVFLETGPQSGKLSADENVEVFSGHFANMERLAKERRLLVAGPFGERRHDEALRGLFVLTTDDRAEAEAWAGSDPAVRAGVFVPTFHELVTQAPLAEALERALARVAELEARGEAPSPGDGARGYVLLTAEDAHAAERVLEPLRSREGGVLMFARLDDSSGADSSGDDAPTRAFVLLDAADLDAARTRFAPQLERIGAHVLDEWYASGELANLVD